MLSHRIYPLQEASSEDISVTSGEEQPIARQTQLPTLLSINTAASFSNFEESEVSSRPAIVTPNHRDRISSASAASPENPLPMYRPKSNLNGTQPTNQLSGQTSTRLTPATSAAVAQAVDDTGASRYMNQQNREELFNYDDEVAPENEEPEQELTWRLDPVVSLSDWTIKVFNKETRQAQAYHVHKNVLAVGPRKSEYFVRYFLSHDNVNSSQKSTDIWLERVSADCMPFFLDYIYSTEGKLVINTGNAVGMRHLAQYFGNRILHQKVMKFILSDLSMENVLTYYQDSLTVDDEKVTEITAQKCAENILSIDKKNEMLVHIDPSFFRRIMGSKHIDSDEKKYHLSLLLAEYCQLNKKHLDDQDFTRLTSDRFLPLVHFNAALILLEMEADLVVNNDDNGVISSLQERCIKDLTDHWQELSDMKQTEVLRVLRKLTSGVVADMLVKSLAKAKEKVLAATGEEGKEGEAPKKIDAAKAKVEVIHTQKSYEGRLAEMESKHKSELGKLKAEYEKNLLKIRDVALEKDKTIASLKRELARFERMPNQPGGRLMQSGEQQKPDALPVYGGYTADGLVLTKPKGGGKFAVFFYNKKAVISSSSSQGGSTRSVSSKGGKPKPKNGSSKPKQTQKRQ